MICLDFRGIDGDEYFRHERHKLRWIIDVLRVDLLSRASRWVAGGHPTTSVWREGTEVVRGSEVHREDIDLIELLGCGGRATRLIEKTSTMHIDLSGCVGRAAS